MVRGAFLALGLIVAPPVFAAEIAVDLGTGEVLVESGGDDLRYPASLTKLMTAYVAFEALEGGEIGRDDPVTVSAFAAGQPPVKLGMGAGARLPFGDLLGAAVVGSKNDAAVAVAEAVAGSEAAFVARMNAAAARLGLANTRFANATGLPAPGQRTSARDIALLGRGLLDRFPERARLLSRREVSAAGKPVRTTNPLFGRVAGAEGLKTGFTCAAGYAVAALIEREGRRVLAVTLGHPSKSARLRAARNLIDAAFAGRGGRALDPAASASDGVPLDVGACASLPAPLVATDVPPEERALYEAELARLSAGMQSVPARPAEVPRRPRPPLRPDELSGWGVFLGAHRSRLGAVEALSAARRLGGGRGEAHVEARARDGRVLAILHGLDSVAATRTCRIVASYCIVLPPHSLRNPRARWRR